MSGKADRARTTEREKKEAEYWQVLGATVQRTWRKAQFIGGGKLITKPQDFFDAFDLVAIFPLADRGRGATAWVQVTESPFERSDGTADRNALHGTPPFPWSGPPSTVEMWSCHDVINTNQSLNGFSNVQVIVSYANPRKPERRWWTQKRPAKALQVERLDDGDESP